MNRAAQPRMHNVQCCVSDRGRRCMLARCAGYRVHALGLQSLLTCGHSTGWQARDRLEMRRSVAWTLTCYQAHS